MPLPVRTNASSSDGVLLEMTRPTSVIICLIVWGLSPSREDSNRAAARGMLHSLCCKAQLSFYFCRVGDDEWRHVEVENGKICSSDVFQATGDSRTVRFLCSTWRRLQAQLLLDVLSMLELEGSSLRGCYAGHGSPGRGCKHHS